MLFSTNISRFFIVEGNRRTKKEKKFYRLQLSDTLDHIKLYELRHQRESNSQLKR
jgi:hypothetical protein